MLNRKLQLHCFLSFYFSGWRKTEYLVLCPPALLTKVIYLIGWYWPGLRSQRILALITINSEIISAENHCFTSDSALHITWKSLNIAVSILISSEKPIFQSSNISAEQRCFSANFLWDSSEQRWFFVESRWHFQSNFQFFSKYFEVPQFRGTAF